MRKPRNLLVLQLPTTLLLTFLLSTGGDLVRAEEEAEKAGGKTAANGSKEAADSFSVVQVGEKVSVLKSSDVPTFRKKVSDDYDASLKAYNEAKQKATKSKKKFDVEKPVKPQVKVVASALKTEENAKAFQERTVAQIAEKKKKEKERKEKEREKERERAKNGK